MRSHVINADAGFAYIVCIIYRNPVKQIVSIIDCRVIIRHLSMRLKVHEFMQSFDISVNDNCCLMAVTTACSPPLHDSPPTDTVYVSCQRWTRPMTSFINTLRLTDTGLSLVHNHNLLVRCSCTQLLCCCR